MPGCQVCGKASMSMKPSMCRGCMPKPPKTAKSSKKMPAALLARFTKMREGSSY